MNKFMKHAVGQPFVAATGLAALVHSTWALGTLFAGEQPEGWHIVGWLVPALLIAFALDVGQIATSSEIRSYGLTWRRGVTFLVFAAATYYLQWLYAAHHMPALALAPGVRESWSESATVLRDAAVWIIPALLPLSTLLYTFSGERHTVPTMQVSPVAKVESATSQPSIALPEPEAAPQLPDALTPTEYSAVCSACGWSKTGYANQLNADKGLSTHLAKHCTAIHAPAPVTNGNGHHDHTA